MWNWESVKSRFQRSSSIFPSLPRLSRWLHYDPVSSDAIEQSFLAGAPFATVSSAIGGRARRGATYNITFHNMEQVNPSAGHSSLLVDLTLIVWKILLHEVYPSWKHRSSSIGTPENGEQYSTSRRKEERSIRQSAVYGNAKLYTSPNAGGTIIVIVNGRVYIVRRLFQAHWTVLELLVVQPDDYVAAV